MSNVSDKLLLKSFRIYKLITDFELLDDGENEVSLTTRMGTMIPKKDADNECKVEILVEFKNNREDTILSVVARGGFEIPPKFDTKDSKKQLLQEQGWKLVYLKLQKAIDEILKISNVEFMSLPPFSEMSKK